MAENDRLENGETVTEATEGENYSSEVKIDAISTVSEAEEVITPEEDGPTDYEALAREDIRELTEIFPHLRGVKSITELKDPLRYAALRDLGLTPKEAYLATSEPVRAYDTRSHLRGTAYGARSSAECPMTNSEMAAARELFSGLSDREIRALYKKVTG